MATPKLSITDTALDRGVRDVVVIGTVQGTDGLELAAGAEAVDAAFDGDLVKILGELGATGKAGETVKLATFGKIASPVVLATGLGKVDGHHGGSALGKLPTHGPADASARAGDDRDAV